MVENLLLLRDKEEIEKTLTRSIDARRIMPAFNRCMELLAAAVRLF